MKRILILISLIATLAACKKNTNLYGVDCSENKKVALQEETDSIARYIDIKNANGADIQATLHPNGFYYQILDEGKGTDRPMTCSAINVDYQGRLFGDPLFENTPTIEGNVFDESEGATFNLYSTVAGWQQAIPLLGEGGRMELYLPPSLAYGSQATSGIAANSYLKFEITLNYFN